MAPIVASRRFRAARRTFSYVTDPTNERLERTD